jgi:hypothetical protein
MQANALTEVDAQMNLGCDFYMQATMCAIHFVWAACNFV